MSYAVYLGEVIGPNRVQYMYSIEYIWDTQA